MNTNMREAFLNAKIVRSTGAAIVNTCAKALQGKAGIMRKPGWNASLSFRTAQSLNMKDGCTNPHALMAYDAMVR
jgi:hypothetical protein